MLKKKFEQGFTLLEMMVALVIVSVGLLGVATLQTRGQQFNHISYVRTQATFLAYDLLERIRINSNRGATNSPNNGDEGAYTQGCPNNSSSTSNECDGGTDTSCNPQALVAYDLAQWCYTLNSKTLPNPEVTINFDGINTYTITMCWGNAMENQNTDYDCDGQEGEQWILRL